MLERSRSGRDPVRVHYSVSLLQAAAALYGPGAVAALLGASGATGSKHKKSRE